MKAHNEFPRNKKEKYASELFLTQVSLVRRVNGTLK